MFIKITPRPYWFNTFLRSQVMYEETKLLKIGLIMALALATQFGCAGSTKVMEPAKQAVPVQNESAKPVLSGKVVETMNAGGYTYFCLEKDGRKGWVAVPTMEAKVGDELELMPGAEMGPFVSKTLNRTFPQMIFSSGPVVKPAGQPATLPSGHPAMPAASGQKGTAAPTDDKGTMAEKPLNAGKVVETMSSGGYTYICLEKDGKKSWAAVPPTDVKIGEEIELLPGTEMGLFKSKTLNRTFENIIFSSGIAPKK
jgi:hypothetical protein